MTDPMDELLKKGLKGGPAKDIADDVPDDDELYRYVTDQMSADEKDRMLSVLRSNAQAQELVLELRRNLNDMQASGGEQVPGRLLDSAKKLPLAKKAVRCPYCGKSITPFKEPLQRQRWLNFLWASLGLFFFALSFLVRHYFMQCLGCSLFFGVKWIVASRSTKTQVLIYKALKDADHSEPNDCCGPGVRRTQRSVDLHSGDSRL